MSFGVILLDGIYVLNFFVYYFKHVGYTQKEIKTMIIYYISKNQYDLQYVTFDKI